jgi:hypothetical protein
VIWAALMLMVALAVPAAWAWNFSRRMLATTDEAQRGRLIRRSAFMSAGVGAAILALGVVAFVLTGYNWLVLVPIWSFGLLHLGLVARTFRRAQNRNQPRR